MLLLQAAIFVISIICFQLKLTLSLPIASNFYALNYHVNDVEIPDIQMVVFVTGQETQEQLALMPKIHSIARLYGGHKLEERSLPTGTPTYASSANQPLQVSWYKMQVTREVLMETTAKWLLTFELSALPTDGSAAVNFAELIDENPSVSVFLKKTASGFGMAMYRNDENTKGVVESIWRKRSATSSVAVAFASYTFWNPSILSKVKFL
jgi:hypothetical protein